MSNNYKHHLLNLCAELVLKDIDCKAALEQEEYEIIVNKIQVLYLFLLKVHDQIITEGEKKE